MSMKLDVKGMEIKLFNGQYKDYISLTDIAKYNGAQSADNVIHNWMGSRNALEFIGLWERLNNSDFDTERFEKLKDEAGLIGLSMTPGQWLAQTNAIGFIAKGGRHKGVYAHKDIAFEFAGWLCMEFKLCLVKAFHCLKNLQDNQLGWKVRRDLTKINYRLHTEAIKRNLINDDLNTQQIGDIYSAEADVINRAMFGKTAAQWREENPDAKGNIRDSADLSQLMYLATMENLNAALITEGFSQAERVGRLEQVAQQQTAIMS